MLDLRRMAAVLGGVVSNNQVLAPGPGHSREDRSLAIKIVADAPDGFVVHSFSPGDDPIACKDYVRERLNLPAFQPNGARHPNGQRRRKTSQEIEALLAQAIEHQSKPKGTLIATYRYVDRDGTLLYQILRYADPKRFTARRPDGKGWIWNLQGQRRVLYRWAYLLEYPDATCLITEGEKDCDRGIEQLKYPATTVAFGQWTPDCIDALRGRDCWILEDNDDTGRKKALDAATKLDGIAASVKIIRLPGLAEGGDISDWLDAGHTVEEFEDVCHQTPDWTPAEGAQGADPGEENVTTASVAPKITSEDESAARNDNQSEQAKPPQLRWLDMSNWDNKPRPERAWAILNRVPLNQAGLFSGEGGTGKSIIEIMKDVSHVAGKDWLGSLPVPGPAFYIGSEDDEKEIHIRIYDIAAHYSVTFEQLIAGGLRVLCLLGQDATLCATRKSGKVETTALYRQLYEAAGDIKPKNISIDTLSRAFAGSEIDRVQVYGFATHMQALAMVSSGSVTVLSHPSLQGIASGSGISGSTAWHGAFRFRQYLRGIKATDGEQPDSDLREIEFKKNQYGPTAETIPLRYQRGLFLPVAGVGSLDKMAREAKIDEIFLYGLRQIIQQGRDAMVGATSPEFGPALIATLPDAKKERIGKKELADAMTRLLVAGKIHVGKTSGSPSRAKKCLRPGAAPPEAG
jgi:RecA-family ATPase